MKKILILVFVMNFIGILSAKNIIVEQFDWNEGWEKILAENSKIEISLDKGYKNKSIKMDYNLGSQKLYAVIAKKLDLLLPENYKFTFYVKGEGKNNLEFKLIDEDGNTFWKIFENKKFPSNWEKITIYDKDIIYAWGPKKKEKISLVKSIELGISGGETQKGIVWFDELDLIQIVDDNIILKPSSVKASSQELDLYPPENVFDGKMETRWSSQFLDNQWFEIDLGETKKISGLTIFWEAAYTKIYDVEISVDGKTWKKVYATQNSDGGRDEIFFQAQNIRFVKLNLHKRATSWGNSIYEIILRPASEEIKLSASSSKKETFIYNILDNDHQTVWHSGKTNKAIVELNFVKEYELGGLFIFWDNDFAKDYTIDYSVDGKLWQNIKTVTSGNGDWDKFYFDKVKIKYLRINCIKSATGAGFGIRDIEIKGADESVTPLRLYEIKAEEAPAGYYPIWLSKKQIYWTVSGVLDDDKEILLSEFSDVEPDKGSFSIMPYLYLDNKLITRNDVIITHKLEKDYLPIPSVIWENDKINFETKAIVYGKEDESVAYMRYKVKNVTKNMVSGKFYLTIRPFQVNPPWQYGGLSKIENIYNEKDVIFVDNKKIFTITPPAKIGFVTSREGDIIDYVWTGKLFNLSNKVYDENGFASGAIEYDLILKPEEEKNFYIAIPLHKTFSEIKFDNFDIQFENMTKDTTKIFDDIVSKTEFNIRQKDVLNTLKSNLLYLLINKDKDTLHPGSRNYQRAWMRDGALMCRALLNMGYTKGIEDFIEIFAKNQFSDGKIPAIIDVNGVDPIDEFDSQGQFVYVILQYYYHTKNKLVLEKYWPNIKKALEFLVQLRNKRLTEEYKNGPVEKRILYGILPESVSHEGYFNPPRHSYWDDFWALKGYKDAKIIAKILGKNDMINWIQREETALRKSLLESIKLVMRYRNIDYIPGCAELGDFDPTSTAIAVAICDETKYLPQEILENTFDKYYREKDLNLSGNYSPYEVRIIEAFVLMGQKDRANDLLKYLLRDRRPLEWNHFAEVVHRDYRLSQYIGDMPHTWIGAEYINSVRSMLVLEGEESGILMLCKGLTEEWISENEKIGVRNLPTIWGKINFEMTRTNNSIKARINGDIKVPKETILYVPVNKKIKEVRINGKEWEKHSGNEVNITNIPAEIEIKF